MNRMDKVFNSLDSKILILYFPIQDTILGDDVEWAKKYFENGCTVLEIGLPNDNPVLDGETVRKSMERALSHSDLETSFDQIKKIREQFPDNILQIMTYYHVIENMGLEHFVDRCVYADVDAVLSPNTPKEMVKTLDEALLAKGIYNLRFVPYHLNDEVIADLVENSRGYIFQQAVDGGTGAQPEVSKQVEKNVAIIKQAGVKTPVCAGFGISNADHVKEAINMGVDGVIVGSATISNIIKGEGESFIHSLSKASKR